MIHLLRNRWSVFPNLFLAFNCAESSHGRMAGSPQERILNEWLFENARPLSSLENCNLRTLRCLQEIKLRSPYFLLSLFFHVSFPFIHKVLHILILSIVKIFFCKRTFDAQLTLSNALIWGQITLKSIFRLRLRTFLCTFMGWHNV